MKKYNITNNGYATLELPISDSDTTILLAGPYETLPTSNFILKITHREAGEVKIRENVYVTNRVGSTCTGVIRAYEPVPMNETSERAVQQAYAFEAGDIVEVSVSAEIIQDLQNEVENKLGKSEMRNNLENNGFVIVENGEEKIKNFSIAVESLDIDGLPETQVGHDHHFFPIREWNGKNKKITLEVLKKWLAQWQGTSNTRTAIWGGRGQWNSQSIAVPRGGIASINTFSYDRNVNAEIAVQHSDNNSTFNDVLRLGFGQSGSVMIPPGFVMIHSYSSDYVIRSCSIQIFQY